MKGRAPLLVKLQNNTINSQKTLAITRSKKPFCNLIGLTLEMLDQVITFLPKHDKLLFSSTCKYLRKITILYVDFPYFNLLSNEILEMILNYCNPTSFNSVCKKWYKITKKHQNVTKYVALAKNNVVSRLIQKHNGNEKCIECKTRKADVTVGKLCGGNLAYKLICEDCNRANYSHIL